MQASWQVKMSLFQVREWWHVTVGEGEEFDSGNMVVGNLDNDPSGAGMAYMRTRLLSLYILMEKSMPHTKSHNSPHMSLA